MLRCLILLLIGARNDRPVLADQPINFPEIVSIASHQDGEVTEGNRRDSKVIQAHGGGSAASTSRRYSAMLATYWLKSGFSFQTPAQRAQGCCACDPGRSMSTICPPASRFAARSRTRW